MKIKRFNELIIEDASTTASVGSGTAVGGGAVGSFTSAAGVSVSGGDSPSSFSTGSGMGAVYSAQPSDIPGDVAGSTKGSGDIGQRLGNVYTKEKKKKKKVSDKINAVENTVIKTFSNMYIGESKKTPKYNYIGVVNKNITYIYVVPTNTEDAYNIGYIDEDGKFVMYNKFKFKKEDLNKLNALQITPKQKLEIENTVTAEDLNLIENYIKNDD